MLGLRDEKKQQGNPGNDSVSYHWLEFRPGPVFGDPFEIERIETNARDLDLFENGDFPGLLLTAFLRTMRCRIVEV